MMSDIENDEVGCNLICDEEFKVEPYFVSLMDVLDEEEFEYPLPKDVMQHIVVPYLEYKIEDEIKSTLVTSKQYDDYPWILSHLNGCEIVDSLTRCAIVLASRGLNYAFKYTVPYRWSIIFECATVTNNKSLQLTAGIQLQPLWLNVNSLETCSMIENCIRYGFDEDYEYYFGKFNVWPLDNDYLERNSYDSDTPKSSLTLMNIYGAIMSSVDMYARISSTRYFVKTYLKFARDNPGEKMSPHLLHEIGSIYIDALLNQYFDIADFVLKHVESTYNFFNEPSLKQRYIPLPSWNLEAAMILCCSSDSNRIKHIKQLIHWNYFKKRKCNFTKSFFAACDAEHVEAVAALGRQLLFYWTPFEAFETIRWVALGLHVLFGFHTSSAQQLLLPERYESTPIRRIFEEFSLYFPPFSDLGLVPLVTQFSTWKNCSYKHHFVNHYPFKHRLNEEHANCTFQDCILSVTKCLIESVGVQV